MSEEPRPRDSDHRRGWPAKHPTSASDPAVPAVGPVVPDEGSAAPAAGFAETCDHCGSTRVEWRRCKLVCLACQQIVRSCADL
ncbi:MAG TPA: hypothetical protein VJU87_10665 [Gemmatimonadaceae bacterium]|nr:hypothetical protein [Gemmatimonadaceae bacterium]